MGYAFVEPIPTTSHRTELGLRMERGPGGVHWLVSVGGGIGALVAVIAVAVVVVRRRRAASPTA